MRRQQLLQRVSPKRWLDFGQKVNEYDQEKTQSHTADQPTAPLQEWSFMALFNNYWQWFLSVVYLDQMG